MFPGSKAPYGYRKDPEDKHHLLIDDAAADNVCRIFTMAENGWGFFKIAKTLQSTDAFTLPSVPRFVQHRA